MTRKRWRNPDKRMAHAAELRTQGWSLRQIGAELGVSEGTVRNDLKRHEEARPPAGVIQLRSVNTQRNCAPNSADLRTPITQEDAG